MTVRFLMEDRDQMVAKASGAWPRTEAAAGCPYNVGDLISFPDFPNLMYQVTVRYYRQGSTPDQSEWLVKLEHVPNPFGSQPEALTD